MNRSTTCLAAVLVVTTACGWVSSPDRTLTQYLDATRRGDWNAAYAMLSKADRSFQALDAYRKGFDEPMAVGLLAKTSYKMQRTVLAGDRASVVVAVTAPDLSGMMGTLMASAMASAFSGGKTEGKDIAAELAKKVEGGGLPTVTRDETFSLVKEDGGWKVYLGLEPKASVAEGKDFLEHKKYAEAKAKYEAALKADPQAKDASDGLRTATAALELVRVQEAYFPKIEIRNVTVKRGSSFIGKYALLEGEVKNTGERTLNRLEVTATCLDKDGKPVYEMDDLVFAVVKDGGFVSAMNPEFGQPLKANFSRRLLVNLEKAPTDWAGQVSVKVKALEFEL